MARNAGRALRKIERETLYETLGRHLWRMRLMPSHTLRLLTGIHLPPHERYWINTYSVSYKENNIIGSRGTSKCLAVGTKVIMADGSRRAVEDVRVGEQVMGPDSQPRTVLATNRGVGPLFRVHQTSAADYVVNDVHILSTKKSRNAATRTGGVFGQWVGDIVNLPVQDYAAQTPYVREHLRGYRAGLLHFPEQPVAVDPYYLGLWLGDGCGCRTAITTMDPEIREYCQHVAESVGAQVVVHEQPNNQAVEVCINYGRTGRAGNPFLRALAGYGVTTAQHERPASKRKHIPQAYLSNSEEVRLHLLAGLIDSDGTVNSNGYAISQVNERLARDIKYLADTLGFRTSITERPTRLGEYRGSTWTVAIYGDVYRIPCRLPRKQITKDALRPNKDKLLSQLTVEPAGDGEWAGFLIDGDHLFLLEDGTVTHNTFCLGSVAPELDAVLHKAMDTLVVSASGFRGGKLILEDAKRLIQGDLRSQRLPAPFLQRSVESPKVIRQEPDRWIVKWSSTSQVMTVPSNNADAMRGIRARKAVIDERNFFDGAIVQTVIRQMLNVGADFEKVASAEDDNAIYQISTIDYTFRDWWKEVDAAKRMAKREYEVMTALLDQQDYRTYHRGMSENKNELRKASFSYSRFDYTDLLIPTEIYDAEDGETYEVNYPLAPNLRREDLVKYDERDSKSLWYTYPVSKQQLEEPLLNGTMDEDLWLAENRNVFIEAAGSVYPDKLVKSVSEVSIYETGKVPGAVDDESEFFPPVLISCGDPCVVGVDYARERDDFAVVVIRLGPLADGKFKPDGWLDEKGRRCYGNTPWSSVIWAESWPHQTAEAAADIIRGLMSRFNIINKTGDITLAGATAMGPGGIGMDHRGGGSAVRDELARPKPTMTNGVPDKNWTEPIKLYDPSDDDYAHYGVYNDPDKYWSGLRLLTPPNAENWEWTRATKAGMEQKLLWIGFYEAPGTWAAKLGLLNETGMKDAQSPEYAKWLVGYSAIKKLTGQLVRLQTEMTPSGLIRVVMPGGRGTEEGKKDLYSAYIYGWHIARSHLVELTKADEPLQNVAPVMFQLGGMHSTYNAWDNL